MRQELDVTLFNNAPYFHVQKVGAQLVTRGTASCCLGHKILRGSHREPDGVFTEWQWDGRRLNVKNDRYGMFAVFYFSTASEFCISSSLYKLLAEGAPPDIDWTALAVFLRIGFYIGEDTPFKAIRCLPPHAQLVWEDGQIHVVGGYHFVAPQKMSRASAIEGYIALFRAAMERRMPDHDNYAVPLSGGRDSRHILLELCERQRPPRYCITGRRYSPAAAEDERIAVLVTEAVRGRHVLVDPPPGQIRSLLRSNIKTNMSAPRRAWKLAIAEHLKNTVTVSYDGIGGDMLGGASAFDAERVDLVESGQYAAYFRYEFYGIDRVLSQLLQKRQYQLLSMEQAIVHLEGELKRHLEASNPIISFNFWNRTRRFDSSAPYGVYADIPTVYSPFLDHDLYDFLTSLPTEMMVDGQFRDEAIRIAYPMYSSIPYEVPVPPVMYNARQVFSSTRELIAYVFRNWPLRFVDPYFILPRLAVDLGVFGSRSTASWFIPTVIYLMQLESIVYKGAVAVNPGPSRSDHPGLLSSF